MMNLQDYIAGYYWISGFVWVIGGFFAFVLSWDSQFSFKDNMKIVLYVYLGAIGIFTTYGILPTILYKIIYLPLQHLVN